MVDARAIARGVTGTTGMVTAREPVASLSLPAVEEFVFLGHDIRAQSIEETAEAANDAGGVPDRDTFDAVREDLREIDGRVNTGTTISCGEVVENLAANRTIDQDAIGDIVMKIRADYAAFVDSHDRSRQFQ